MGVYSWFSWTSATWQARPGYLRRSYRRGAYLLCKYPIVRRNIYHSINRRLPANTYSSRASSVTLQHHKASVCTEFRMLCAKGSIGFRTAEYLVVAILLGRRPLAALVACSYLAMGAYHLVARSGLVHAIIAIILFRES